MPESSEASFTLAGDLHARPAGALSVAAVRYPCAIQLSVDGRQADAKSVLAVMQLGASSGQQVTVRAAGPDADDAVAALIGILSTLTPAGE
jgi:phosphotransferase system HPr (HPr) family protein